jgi:hypothetical protein
MCGKCGIVLHLCGHTKNSVVLKPVGMFPSKSTPL